VAAFEQFHMDHLAAKVPNELRLLLSYVIQDRDKTLGSLRRPDMKVK
jgi:hypothetical protein